MRSLVLQIHRFLVLFVRRYKKEDFFFLNEIRLNFIYFTTITKQVIQLILIMLVGTDVFGWSSCRRKPECPEETHLSDLVTHDHLTCRRRVSNPSRSGERRVR